MRFAASLALLALMAAPARSEDVPLFDITLFCETNVRSFQTIEDCRRKEQRGLALVTSAWETFPAQRKHFCVQSVSFRPKVQRSYDSLVECLDDRGTS
jgi:hypothetical protein